MRFISPKTDFAFKKIFGSSESKDILVSFLNALIYGGNPKIKDLEIIDPYNAGSVVELKDSYLDVKAVLDDESTVLVEMQVLNVDAFGKRVVYNLAKTYSNQLSSGSGYSSLKPVIALIITDFKMFSETERVINSFRFKEEELMFDYRDRELRMVFVELPKFKKELPELSSLTEKWIYFMKSAPSLEAVPTVLGEVPEIEKAFQIANKANMTVKELEELHKREVFIEDRRGEIIKARREGREEGRLEGQILLILRMLERRFGEIPTALRDEMQKLSLSELEMLSLEIFDFTSLSDLSSWLRSHVIQ